MFTLKNSLWVLLRLLQIIELPSKTHFQGLFGVFAHNRDDHSKNFTYIYNEQTDTWHLSPAYDLTYSTTYYGEHTTTVNGNGSTPTKQDMLAVGVKAGMKKGKCLDIIDEIESCVKEKLGKYL